MPIAVWAGFIVFVLVAMAIDLGLYQKRTHGMSTRAALTWVGIWMTMALLFNAGIYQRLGTAKAEEFLAGYLLELSLSVDNLFVFVLVFSHFRTPRAEQHRVLVWGIIGAMVLRAVMILAGSAVVKRFEGVMLLFAAILIVSGAKLLFKGDDDDADPADSFLVRTARRTIPLVDEYRGHDFFVLDGGKRKATLLFLVLVIIELSDVLFAVDSIPAIFGITTDPFIVFTSNIFAILGLRSLFFVIEAAIQRLQYLKVGLAVILIFIGVKMTLPFLEHFLGWQLPLLPPGNKIPVSASLLVIVGVLGGSMLVSLLKAPKQKAAPAPGAPPSDEQLRANSSGRMPVPQLEAPPPPSNGGHTKLAEEKKPEEPTA